MDSDEEDVSENDILDWYKDEVADIWDTATDSAFTDLSSNFTEMFRQVMNDVKQRNQSSQMPNGHTVEVNDHSSVVNGVHEQQPTLELTTNTVSVSSHQLIAMLQDEDDDWLEESNTPIQDEEPMILSVQLTDPQNSTEEEQKNVRGVSQENNPLADSIILLFATAPQSIMSALHLSLCFFVLLIALFTAPLIHKPLQIWFLENVQDYIYLDSALDLHAYSFLADLREETVLISNLSCDYEHKSADCQSCGQTPHVKKEKHSAIKSQNECYSSRIPIMKDTELEFGDTKEVLTKPGRKLLRFTTKVIEPIFIFE